MELIEKVNHLKKLLKQWEYEYYVLDNPSVSDIEFDETLKELLKIEKEHPELITPDSPTQRVGGSVIEKFEKVKHQFPMMSLSNAFSEEDLRKFDSDIHNIVNKNKIKYHVEPKIDGLSISLIYHHGVLEKAITRGDGQFGEDVINNIRTIKTIPLKINPIAEWFEVRGEVFLTKKQFAKINSELPDEEKFANCRNAAAGSLRNLDSSIAAKRNLCMISYNIPNALDYGLKTQTAVIAFLQENGFMTAKYQDTFDTIDGVIEFIKKITQERSKIEYDIDGLVVKYDNINDYEIIGQTSKFPKWAIAYKFPANIVVTKLLNIKSTVGRTGKICYVAELEPVKLDGSIIASATLHNAEYILTKDIRIGDKVRLYKAGEIIPKIIGPVLEERKGELKEFKEIKTCPVCGSELIKIKDEIDQYCPNISCRSRVVASLVHFASKDAMDIRGMSDKIIEKLYDKKFLVDIPTIYNLKDYKDKITSAGLKIKDKMINNLINSIEQSKSNSLERLIFGLGIRHVGEQLAKTLAKRFQDIDTLKNASRADLEEINDVGEIAAESIFDFFANSQNIDLIEKLKALGINTKYINNDQNVDTTSIYYKKNFVITGKFDVPRSNIKAMLIKKYDANILPAISSKVDFLLLGQNEKESTKLKEAKALNIKIITERIW